MDRVAKFRQIVCKQQTNRACARDEDVGLERLQGSHSDGESGWNQARIDEENLQVVDVYIYEGHMKVRLVPTLGLELHGYHSRCYEAIRRASWQRRVTR